MNVIWKIKRMVEGRRKKEVEMNYVNIPIPTVNVINIY